MIQRTALALGIWILLLFRDDAGAQTVTSITQSSAVSSYVPAALTPGAPAGTYAVTDLETTNLYNGNLSVSIPLLSIGGRGKVNISMSLSISRPPWIVNNSTVRSCTELSCRWEWISTPYADWYRPSQSGQLYGAGGVYIRRSAAYPTICPTGGQSSSEVRYVNTFTHLVYVRPDGTEHPLYDAGRQGYWSWNNSTSASCLDSTPLNDRGSLFTATDGSGIAFLFDPLPNSTNPDLRQTVSDLNDGAVLSGIGTIEYVSSGQLKFPDGTIYRIDGGKVRTIRDANGNTISFTYKYVTINQVLTETTAVATITDPLGRLTSIDYNQTEPGICTGCDRIRFPGTGGVERVIRVQRVTNARFRLRQDYLNPNPGSRPDQIESFYAGNPSPPNPAPFIETDPHLMSFHDLPVVSKIILPDKRQYQFFYNKFGEVARMTLPTGGDIEYDYWSGIAPNPSKAVYESGWIMSDLDGTGAPANQAQVPTSPWAPLIYRRLKERRTYANYTDNSRTLLSTTTFNRPEELGSNSPGPGSDGKVTSVIVNWAGPIVKTVSGKDVSKPSVSRHFFYNTPSKMYGFNVPTAGNGGPVRELLVAQGNIADYPEPFVGKEYKTEVGTATVSRQTVEKTWFVPTGNAGTAQVCHEKTRLDGGAGASKVLAYDIFSNVTDTYEFGYAQDQTSPWVTRQSPVNPSYSADVHLCPSASNSYLRHKKTSYVGGANYTNVTGAYLTGLPSQQLVCGQGPCDSANYSARTDWFYDDNLGGSCGAAVGLVSRGAVTQWDGSVGSNRGNLSCQLNYATGTSALKSLLEYDSVGNVVKRTEAGTALNMTIASGCGGFTNTYAMVQSVSNAAGHTARYDYDCWTGRVTGITDPNSIKTILSYEGGVDQLDRLSLVKEGTAVQPSQSLSMPRETAYEYSSTAVPPVLTIRKDLFALGDRQNVSTVQYDGYGRTVQTAANESANVDLIEKTVYDGLGRERQRSNPYRTGETAVYTTTAYDEAGRPELTTFPDGSEQSIVYNGAQQIVTEPGGSVTSGRQRWLSYDALGMLVTVREAGTQDGAESDYYTNYDYNLLDNLVAVTQGGQHRCFYYDPLGRMTHAMNPESYGAIANCPYPIPSSGVQKWEYDANGNVKKVTQPGGKWKENTVFDAINRVTSITYSSANTPAVSLGYDTCANGVGQLCVASNGLSSETRSYDVLGRVANSAQQMPLASGGTTLAAFPFQYEYDLGGGLKRMVYPSGREVLRESDKLGRAARLRGKASAGGSVFDYVGSLRYAAHGGVELSALGNGKKQQACYNNRLQVKAMRVGDADTAQCAAEGADWLRLGFDYGTTNNNGNVRSQTIEARKDAGGFTSILQSYAHDGVNRLTQMTETGGAASWTLNVGYDRYGNQWQGSPTESLSTLTARNGFQVDAATNRLVKYWNDSAVPAGAYDADGNLVNYTGIGASIFDGENRIVSVTGTGGTTAFEYDGNGRRVRKTAAGTSTLFVYDASGKLAAEYNGQTAAAGRFYVSGDHLGSTRLTMDASGGRVSCADYLPFGEEIQTGTAAAMRSGVGCFNGGAPLRQKFTGKERDVETGLDYFGARYMSGPQGRFTSADPHNPIMIAQMASAAGLPTEAARSQMNAFLEEPQNWNKYSHVRNNPLRFTDPFGEAPVEGHHLIPARQGLTGLAAEFTNAVKAGADGVGYPNQPGFNGPHRAYNAAADQILQGFEKQFGASRNSWSLSQWRQAANGILNSNNKTIRAFLDLLNENNAGRTIPALAAAINAYKPSAALIASSVGESLLNLFRLPLFIMVDPALTDSQRRVKEEIKKSHSNCLLDRATGNCVVY